MWNSLLILVYLTVSYVENIPLLINSNYKRKIRKPTDKVPPMAVPSSGESKIPAPYDPSLSASCFALGFMVFWHLNSS